MEAKKRRSKYADWDKDAERLILYADVMGFKSRVMTRSHADLKEELIKFREAWDSRISPLKLNEYLKFVQFSDSMLIVVKGIDEKMFNLITKAAVSLLQIAIEKKFPIKGAIAQGTFSFYNEKQLYFGQPLCDAAILHDQLKFYGIAVHHSAEKAVRSFKSDLLPYSKTPIPIDKGEVAHYHLCWNLLDKTYQPKDMTAICEKWLETIEESVSGEPRMYVDRTLKVLRRDSKEFTKNQKEDEDNHAEHGNVNN